MFRERTDEIKFAFLLLDLFLAGAAYSAAFAMRFFLIVPSDYNTLDKPLYALFGGILVVSQVGVYSLLNLYTARRFLSSLDEVGVVLSSVIINLFFSFAVLYYLHLYDVSRLLPLLYGFWAILLTLVGHVIFRRLVLRWRQKGHDLLDVLIVGGGAAAQKAAEVIEKNRLFGLRVSGFVLEPSDDGEGLGERVLGRIEELENLVEKLQPRYMIYAGHSDYHENLKQVLSLCDSQGIHLQIVPSYSDFVTVNGSIENYDGLPVLTIRDIPARSGVNRVLKRTFDLVFSGVFLLVFSELFLLIALLVKLTSKGPVFFLQERVGLDNETFKMLKFRTMRVQNEKDSATIWTTKDDPRVTPLGRFLRRTSLDEIPQFINIFLGQMSVVGPRPERPYFVEQFKNQYPYFKRRHAVKAGLTGWAQINGLRGDTSIQDRVDADIYYIENWSVFLDLKIVLLTPFKGLFGKNAY